MADIPEEAVERAARAWCGSEFFAGTAEADTYERLPESEKQAHQHYARAGLKASGALFLTEEEKRALLQTNHGEDCAPRPREKGGGWNCKCGRLSARQKLEESLK